MWKLRNIFLVSVLFLVPACSLWPFNSSPPRQYPKPRISQPQHIECTKQFDPCRCDIQLYEITNLDRRLNMRGSRTHHIIEAATDLFDAAHKSMKLYWDHRDRRYAYRALRFYHEYMKMTPRSDSQLQYAYLHSIAIYCKLGCDEKSDQLVHLLQRTGIRYLPNDFRDARSYCD